MALLDDIGALGGPIGIGLANLGNQVSGGSIGNTIDSVVQGPQAFSAPSMDPGSSAQVGQIQNSMQQSPQQYSGQIMQGTGAASNIQNNTGNAQTEQNELGGGGIPGMQQAIGNKAAKNFAVQQGKLQQNANFSGQQMANQNMNTAASNAIALQNAQNGVNSAVNSYNLQSNAARYQTISSLMSGAGSFGGYAYGNSQGNQSGSSPLTNSQMGAQDFGAGETESVFNAPNSGFGNYGSSALNTENEGMGNYGLSGGI